ncbi:MAG: hypothetical protein IT555_16840 [Acetobacteraceae bacterium]|nr:hypothetical protein [Acetobacteraceae bacterium]
MISVILYGRNDSYGYNLHKRAALSFNCIAEVLDAPDDEILFVDYNTPDDFPTFPEAIRDTLSEQAKRKLRILRVRPAHHRRFAKLSHLVALEPVARNAAVRRANPANRWLLSTNTDMIFVPRTGRSLSAIAAPLADGYYHLSRLEIPESLWESLDRGDAAGTIAAVGRWGQQFHLNEITEHELEYLRYDAPGDFQLMLRADAHRIWGFDERMLLGYHVDSNIAARLYQLYGHCGDVQDDLFGYHCDHTRQVTPAHRHDAVQNDAHKFVFGIDNAFDARGQAESWGLAGETLEEVRLDGGRVTYLDALTRTITAPMGEPTRTVLGAVSLEKVDYDPRHVLPFLLDGLVEYPRDSVLGWFGSRADTLALFAAAWRTLGFTGAVLVPAQASWLGQPLPEGVTAATVNELLAQAHMFVLDGGIPRPVPEGIAAADTPELRHVTRGLRLVVEDERRLMKQRSDTAAIDTLPAHLRTPRRVIGINGFLNMWEHQFSARIGAAKSPGSTRVRQGFVLPGADDSVDILPAAIGERVGNAIRIRPGRRGQVFVCPCVDLTPGRWRFALTLTPQRRLRPRIGPLKLEVLRGSQPFARRFLVANGVLPQQVQLDFDLPGSSGADAPGTDVMFRLHTIGMVEGQFSAATLTRLAG